MWCKKCKSDNVVLKNVVFKDQTKHTKLTCIACKASYHIERIENLPVESIEEEVKPEDSGQERLL